MMLAAISWEVSGELPMKFYTIQKIEGLRQRGDMKNKRSVVKQQLDRNERDERVIEWRGTDYLKTGVRVG